MRRKDEPLMSPLFFFLGTPDFLCAPTHENLENGVDQVNNNRMFSLRAKMAKRYIVFHAQTQSYKWVRSHACAGQSALLLRSLKGKDKILPRTGHEGPKGE
jgi:hypothetical protein